MGGFRYFICFVYNLLLILSQSRGAEFIEAVHSEPVQFTHFACLLIEFICDPSLISTLLPWVIFSVKPKSFSFAVNISDEIFGFLRHRVDVPRNFSNIRLRNDSINLFQAAIFRIQNATGNVANEPVL